jgi:hypothetical protein
MKFCVRSDARVNGTLHPQRFPVSRKFHAAAIKSFGQDEEKTSPSLTKVLLRS